MINRLLTAAATALVLSTLDAQAGDCPAIGAAPRTMNGTAEAYATSPGFSLNDEGILEWDYGAHFDNLGKWADPFFDSNYALALYRDWLDTGCTDDDLRDNFLRQANWLVSKAEMRGNIAVWPYPFADKNFDLDPGWVSGIGQSRIAGVLLRAEAITGSQSFHHTAQAALRAYDVPISEGGVVTIEDDVTWIEEMADPAGRSFKVLNGHITGLAGILDFYQITRDQKWKAFYNRGIAAVKRDISKFDAGFSTYYSLLMPSTQRPIAPLRDYNPLHVSQLLWLYDQTSEPIFLEYASRFQAYETNNDTFTASSSIDKKNHGPDSLRAKYGSHYWSVGKFPAWLDIVSSAPRSVRGVAIDLNLLSEAPSELTISASIDGKWSKMIHIDKVETRYIDAIFDKPVLTDKVRVDLPDDSGDGLVALRTVMILNAEPAFAPVANDCNHTSDSRKETKQSSVENAFDSDRNTNMPVLCDGWIMFPTTEATAKVEFLAEKTESIRVEESDDLAVWSDVTFTNDKKAVSFDAKRKFIRVHFDKSVEGITEVSYSIGN